MSKPGKSNLSGLNLLVAVLAMVVAAWFLLAPRASEPNAVDVSPAGAVLLAASEDGSESASPPRTEERKDKRLRMVAQQIEARGVRNPAVLEAMRNVPRHWFVPAGQQHAAYEDRPLRIGFDQTISQPYIVAFMTEALQLDADSKVLEIGTGSGYQAAVLAEITPHVYTIEIVEGLAKRTLQIFEKRGYRNISCRWGDGYLGWPEAAPFDAIIVTCAPGHIPPKLIEQLKPGGRMCIPVGTGPWSQSLVSATKDKDGTLSRRDILPVRFVPMTGQAEKR